MTYRVADGDDNGAASDGDARTFTIAVQAPEPSFAGSVADQIWPAGQVIAPLVLPAADGGRGTLAYSLRPDIPGLSFDPTGAPERHADRGRHPPHDLHGDRWPGQRLAHIHHHHRTGGRPHFRYRGSGDRCVLNRTA